VNELVYGWALWLDDTQWSSRIHESFYLYNWIETIHVLSLTLSLGLLFLIDLRVLGFVFQDVNPRQFARSLRWPMWLGFCVMFVTGFLLFYAVPVRTSQSIWFRFKLALLVLAAVNALLFNRELLRTGKEPFTLRLKLGAISSMILWVGIVLFGRLIAYDWFDCVQQPPPWAWRVAGCLDGQEAF